MDIDLALSPTPFYGIIVSVNGKGPLHICFVPNEPLIEAIARACFFLDPMRYKSGETYGDFIARITVADYNPTEHEIKVAIN